MLVTFHFTGAVPRLFCSQALKTYTKKGQEGRREEAGGARERRSIDPWWVVLELGSATVTTEQVRAQYRKLIMQHHPDRGGDPEICKKLNAAFADAERHFGGRL
jgi:hypothetical protein